RPLMGAGGLLDLVLPRSAAARRGRLVLPRIAACQGVLGCALSAAARCLCLYSRACFDAGSGGLSDRRAADDKQVTALRTLDLLTVEFFGHIALITAQGAFSYDWH